MAGSAPIHIHLDKWPIKWLGFIFNITMTLAAFQISNRDMAAVRKIGMVRYPVDLNPGDWRVAGNMINHFLGLGEIRIHIFVAITANRNIGDRGLPMGCNLNMAISTDQVLVVNMKFMIKLYGLF